MISNFFYHEVIFNNGNNYHDDGEDFENDHYKDAWNLFQNEGWNYSVIYKVSQKSEFCVRPLGIF